MKKRTLISLIISTLILSICISPGFAQEGQPLHSDKPDSINLESGAIWFTQYVDGAEANSAGAYPSIVFSPGGIPYVSYYNATTEELWYAKRVTGGTGNCGVGDNWSCVMVDTDGDVGRYSSIDYWKSSSIVGRWKLGISYHDSTNRALKVAIYSCTLHFNCSWSINTIQIATVDFQNYGLYTSFKFASDGTPLIGYHFSSTIGSDSLKYAYPFSGGNCGIGVALGEWQCDVLDNGDGVGKYPSLSLTWDGILYIAYYDGGNGNLKYTYYAGIGGNCGPADGWLCSVIDGGDGSDVGLYASFATPQYSGDKFRIAYHDKTNGTLKIAYSHSGGNCDAPGWQCDVVDDTSTSISPMGISLATDESGNPIIAYQKFLSELSPGTLHIAQPARVVGLDWGNCGDVPPGYLFQYWQCETIDNASGETMVANYASVAIDPSGLAMVAYNKWDDYSGYQSLMVAYQVLEKLYLPLIIRAP